MGAPRFTLILICGIFSSTTGSDFEPSSYLNMQGNITSLKQKVLELEVSIKRIPLMIQGADEELLITVLDEMAKQFKNHASTNKEMGEALRKEIEALQSDHSRLQQSLRNQSLLINKLSRQLEDGENSCLGEPPSLANGMQMDFDRKHGSHVAYQCDRHFWATGNSTVHCHSRKWKGQPPVCRFFDSTFTVRAHVDRNRRIYNVTCYGDGNDQKIEFSITRDTGSGETFPSGTKSYSEGKTAVLDFSDAQYEDSRGIFQCGYETEGMRTGISFFLQPQGFFGRPVVAKIGDNLELSHYGLKDHPSWRWLHDGEPVPAGDGLRKLAIIGVKAADAGIYERYMDSNRRGSQHFVRLVVRGCQGNMFGEHCNQECPPCYNGGTCHGLFGACVCPPGFEGRNCEVACGKNRFGANCSESCPGEDCKGQGFCKPDPYGCSCASGYWKSRCQYTCNKGKYGADCKQTCHCAEGNCDPYTGACSGGCSPGWTGQSCQIPAEN